jgi:hypothetical protein
MKPKSVNKVVYTVLIGRGDRISKLNFNINNDIEYVCFTDHKDLVPKGWKVILVDDSFKKELINPILCKLPNLQQNNPTIINRIIKLHPHVFLGNYEKSMYIDAHIELKQCMSNLIDDALQEANWLSPAHRWGGNVLIEGLRCYERNKINIEELYEFLDKMISVSIGVDVPFTENGIIIRNHLDLSVIKMCEQWWDYFAEGPYRDQLHWQCAYLNILPKFKYLPYRFIDDNPYYKLGRHKGSIYNALLTKVKAMIRKF